MEASFAATVQSFRTFWIRFFVEGQDGAGKCLHAPGGAGESTCQTPLSINGETRALAVAGDLLGGLGHYRGFRKELRYQGLPVGIHDPLTLAWPEKSSRFWSAIAMSRAVCSRRRA